ncbi:hypothetical protein [Stratiformator vulcanicus]|nr:hypothetical protein [Stratiformator vulcanicus]
MQTRTTEDDSMTRDNFQNWTLLGVGLTAGLFAGYLTVVRPMQDEMSMVRKDLSAMRAEVAALADETESIEHGASLLSAIRGQQRELHAANDALETIRQFRADVEAEGDRSFQALAAVDLLAGLQDDLIAGRIVTKAAAAEYDRTAELQERIADSAHQINEARSSIDRIEQMQDALVSARGRQALAELSLNRMAGMQRRLIAESSAGVAAAKRMDQVVGLHDRLIAHGRTVAEADKSLDRLADLKYDVILEGTDVQDAFVAADALIGLKREIAAEDDVHESLDKATDLVLLKETVNEAATEVGVARHNAEELIALRDRLAGGEEQGATSAADDHLDGLVSLRNRVNRGAWATKIAAENLTDADNVIDRLADRSDDIANAVESVEILSDLSEEMGRHLSMMNGFRRDLIELAMLEPAITRAYRVIAPLADMANLQRLSVQEVRQAARVILQQRDHAIAAEVSSDTATK